MQSRTRKAVGAVAFAATLTGGAVAGAMLGIPSVSDAAQPTATSAPSSTTAPKTDSSAPDDHGGPGHHGFGFEVFDLGEAAKVLGISEDELKTRLANGDTLAEIAKDEGVDVQKVIDALVTAGTKAIDEAAADAKAHLEDRITELVNNGFPGKGDHPGPGGPGMGHFGFGFPDLATVAKTLGLSEDQLMEKLRSGQSLADIAKAQGVDVDKIVTDVVKAIDDRIDEQVAAGHLDKDKAAEIKKDLEARIRTFVENGFPGPWGHRPR
jgi:uncharacterized protein YidB (DUF937 family)